MAEDVKYLKKQIEKEMGHLRDLSKINRIEKIESALKRKFPGMKVDKNLLGLIGTMPYNPPSKDKGIVRRITAERHA
jgi:hypothetical protein